MLFITDVCNGGLAPGKGAHSGTADDILAVKGLHPGCSTIWGAETFLKHLLVCGPPCWNNHATNPSAGHTELISSRCADGRMHTHESHLQCRAGCCPWHCRPLTTIAAASLLSARSSLKCAFSLKYHFPVTKVPFGAPCHFKCARLIVISKYFHTLIFQLVSKNVKIKVIKSPVQSALSCYLLVVSIRPATEEHN